MKAQSRKPRVSSPDDTAGTVRRMYESGMSSSSIAEHLGCSQQAVRDYLRVAFSEPEDGEPQGAE